MLRRRDAAPRLDETVTRRGRMLLDIALAALGGAALWLSWPTTGLWWAAPIGVALLALATRARSGRAGLGLGVVAGLAAYLPALSWSGVYVGALPWVALATLEALYVGLTGWAHARLTRVHGGIRPLVVATAWTAGEMLRSTTPFGGFPWIKIAYSQADSPMLALARLVSSVGLTFAVALVGGLLAVAALAAARRRPTAALTAVAGAGALALGPSALPVPTDGTPLPVLAIQGDVPTEGLDFNAQRRAVLDYHVQQTLLAAQEVAAGRRAQPTLVVWPENASDIDPLRNADAGALITKAASAIKAPIVVGGLRINPQGRVENTSWWWTADAGPTQSYAKRHPVPFGEYIPYRSFFRLFSDKVDLVTADMVPGQRVGVFSGAPVSSPDRTTVLRVGLGICFEVAYDDVLLDTLDHGATLLAIQTNNATFGHTAESYQQLAVSRVRAVEYGRSVVHISTVGTSALITPDGRAHQQTGLFVPARLSMDLPLRTERTPGAAVGLWPGYVALGAVALLLVADTAGRVRPGAQRRSAPARRERQVA